MFFGEDCQVDENEAVVIVDLLLVGYSLLAGDRDLREGDDHVEDETGSGVMQDKGSEVILRVFLASVEYY